MAGQDWRNRLWEVDAEVPEWEVEVSYSEESQWLGSGKRVPGWEVEVGVAYKGGETYLHPRMKKVLDRIVVRL